MNPVMAHRPTLVQGETLRLYPGMTRLNENVAISIKNRSFTVSATIEAPEGTLNGVIVTQGGRTGGWVLFVEDGRPGFHYNFCGLERTSVVAETPLAPGQHEVRAEFTYDGGGLGKGGSLTLSVDGAESGSGRIARTHPLYFSFDEAMDVGVDTGMPVYEGYKTPRGRFSGTIKSAEIVLGDDDHSHLIDPQEHLAAAMRHQ
jgi:arylsulfatase